MMEPTILDIGCGNNKQPGAWGVDITKCQADQRFNLDDTPWPLPDNHFTVVYAIQVLEHLEDRVKTMEEIWRVCQNGALVVVSVPNGYCPGYAQDPTHKSPWNIGTFLYFCPGQFMKGSEMPPYDFQAHFQVLDFHVRERVATPWGAQWCADDLWVFLQAIKGPAGKKAK